MNKTFGHRLRDMRRDSNVSQRDLANKVGVDFTYISKLENNKMPPPSAETIEKIAGVLGVDPVELLNFAKKIPTDVQDTLSENIEAVKFLSEASAMKLSKEEWGKLTEKLKRLR